ncbi:hypothetical protein [Rheinheimera sp. KL1]|uniref:hypothetical protein n=1 Tax=Rheinheimera sp. KL1 TaxID=1635005 RepID=UPI00256F5C33|nr:hypothetical protein [Rheinheimera sp. KL1]
MDLHAYENTVGIDDADTGINLQLLLQKVWQVSSSKDAGSPIVGLHPSSEDYRDQLIQV